MVLKTLGTQAAKALKRKKPKQRQTVESRNARRKEALERKLKARDNETPPATQRIFGRRGAGARSIDEIEDTRIDSETGGSVDAAREVGTRGEKVTLDTRGPRTRGYVEDQAGGRTGAARARRYLALKNKVDGGTATRAERLEFMRMAFADADAFTRQQGRNIKSRQAKSTAGRLSARQRENAVQKFYNTGEIVEGFEPTPNQIKIAKQNAKRRKELASDGDDTEAILAGMAERDAARTQPPARKPLSGIRAEDAGGMKDGGLTRKKRKIAEAYKEYMKTSAVKKRKKNVKNTASAKRKRITANIMSAAKGGMAGKKPRNANIDYRKGGMFYVGGTSAKVTPINKGKK